MKVLASRFRRQLRVVELGCGQVGSTRQLLQSLLHELDLPYRGLDEGEMRLSLLDALQPSEECPHGVLLLVDEAHQLSVDLLEELRLLGNLACEGMPRVQLVLAGNGRLEERFTSPQLESFSQRLAARCYLQGLERDETSNYLYALAEDAGGRPEEIWSDDALHAIHGATDGVPRLINQLGDHTLMLAAKERQKRITRQNVEQAWASLQQLPAPWNTSETNGECVIEFGELDGEVAAPAGGDQWTDHEGATSGEPQDQHDTGADEAQEGWEDQTPLEIEIELNDRSEQVEVAIDDALDSGEQPQTDAQPLDDVDSDVDSDVDCLGSGGGVDSQANNVDEELTTEDATARFERIVAADYSFHTSATQLSGEELVSLSADGIEQAEQIEVRLAEVELNSGLCEPSPIIPEELPTVDDPFGDFREEEVVLDHFGDFEQTLRSVGPEVTSLESQLLAEALEIHQETLSARESTEWDDAPHRRDGRRRSRGRPRLLGGARRTGAPVDPGWTGPRRTL